MISLLTRVILLLAVALLPRAASAQGPVWALDFVSTGSASAAVQSQSVLTARVRLTGSPAPAGGFTLALTSSDPRALSVPASITVPAGRSEALFEVRAAAVSVPIRIDVKATAGGRSQVASVTITPTSGSRQMPMSSARGGASSSASGAASPGAAASSGASAGGLGAASAGATAAAGAKSSAAASGAAGGAAADGAAAQGSVGCSGRSASTAATSCGTAVGGVSSGAGTAAGGVASGGGVAAGAGASAGSPAGVQSGAAAGAVGSAASSANAAGGAATGSAAAGGAAAAGAGASAGGVAAAHGGAAVSGATSAAHSVLLSPPYAVAGKMASFVVQARTESNSRSTTGGDAFAARLSGPQSAAVTIKDAGDGTYVGSFTVNTAGAYTLHVLLAGVPIGGSPFAVTVR